MALRGRDFYMFGVIACLSIIDLLTTQIGLKTDVATESNLFLTWVGLDMWRMALVKAAALLIILILLVISDLLAQKLPVRNRRQAETGRTIVLFLLVIFAVAVVINNILLMVG